MTGLAWWSQAAASNATQDSTVNFSEGMAPSAVNDSARALMASAAKWRDDIAGAIVTGGTSTNYTVASYQGFDNLSRLNGQMIAFTPHTTNTGSQCFLNVDGLGTKTIRSATGADVPAGTLIQGTPYTCIYNNSDGVFYLHGFYGNPYSVPIGACIDFFGTTAPNSSFVLPYGQAISRTTYSVLFGMFSTTYGAGDGSTTFNIPDLRGRVVAATDNMGGSDAGRLSGSAITSVRTSIGGAGGEGTHQLTVGELPTGITSSASNNISVKSQSGQTGIPTTTTAANVSGATINYSPGGTTSPVFPASTAASWGATNALSDTNTINVTSNNTSGSVHNNVQPTILGNKLLRII